MSSALYIPKSRNTSSWSHNGEPVPFAPIPWAATFDVIGGNLHAVMQKTLAGERADAAAIEVERIGGPILLVAARDDEMWPSVSMSRRLVARLDRAGFAHAHELLEVDGGHTGVVEHFGAVETFLQQHVVERPGCGPAPLPES